MATTQIDDIYGEVQFDGKDLKSFALLLARMAQKQLYTYSKNRRVYLWMTPNQFDGTAPKLYVSYNAHHPGDELVMPSLSNDLMIEELAESIYGVLKKAPILATN